MDLAAARAIVLAGMAPSRWPELSRRLPTFMLPLVDRPFLQHVVERIAHLGLRHIDLVLTESPTAVREQMGDGTRWGVRIEYHVAKDSAGCLERAQALASLAGESPILLARGDRLPAWGEADPPAPATPGEVVAFCWTGPRGRTTWTGWAWLPAARLADAGSVSPDVLEKRVLDEAANAGRIQFDGPPLAADHLRQLLDSQGRVLSGELPGLLLSGSEREPGVRVGRGAVLSPTARLVGPVFVGERCHVGRGVQLGPGACIGAGSFIDAGASVRDSLVLPDTYVGRGLWLEGVLVDRSLIVSPRHDVEVHVDEDDVLASLRGGAPAGADRRLGSRALAVLGLALGWPVLLALLAVRRIRGIRPSFGRREVVATPGSMDPSGWKPFGLWTLADLDDVEGLAGLLDVTHRVLPGLVNVARGQIALTGLRPRTREELMLLPEHWRSICLSAEAGLVTEALVRHGCTPTEEELFAAESIQSTLSGARHDAALLLAYLRRSAFGARP